MREISWSKFFGTIRNLTKSMPEISNAISVQNPSNTSSTPLRILGKVAKGSLPARDIPRYRIFIADLPNWLQLTINSDQK